MAQKAGLYAPDQWKVEMDRPKRPPAPGHTQSLEELWAELIHTSIVANGGRFGSWLPVFAPRVFIRPNLWRIPEPEELEPFQDAFDRGNLTLKGLQERTEFMRLQTGREPFPSSPFRPPVYVVRFGKPDSFSIHGFCLTGPARVMIEAVLKDYNYTWKSSNHLYVPDLSMTISCDKLEDIMESRDSFELPYPYTAYVARMRGESQSTPQPVDEASQPTPPRPTGGTTIADLAEELGLAPGKARSILRKAGVKKPYCWEDADPIRAILRKRS